MSIVWKIINNLVWFFEFFSFFYIFFQREFRQISRKRIICISICTILWISGLMMGVDWTDSMFTPFPIGLIIIYTILFLLFDINLLEYSKTLQGYIFKNFVVFIPNFAHKIPDCTFCKVQGVNFICRFFY